MKAAISGETLGSVMELDEILSLFQKNGIHFIEIWPENIPVKVGKTLLHKRLYGRAATGRFALTVRPNPT